MSAQLERLYREAAKAEYKGDLKKNERLHTQIQRLERRERRR